MRSDDTRARRADASTAAGRAQRGAAREREGAFGSAVITAELRYSSVTKHYRVSSDRDPSAVTAIDVSRSRGTLGTIEDTPLSGVGLQRDGLQPFAIGVQCHPEPGSRTADTVGCNDVKQSRPKHGS